MQPAQAMGTFLRVWRAEWAGLSREQVATAVSARRGKGRAVTPAVVRKWEAGQPPSDTSELDALLAVMRRHGLTRPETEQFRRCAFAACVSRQYPEYYDDGDFAYRPDVDEAASRLCDQLGPRYWEAGIVQAVACLEALRPVVMGRLYPAPRGTQERRQEVACALLHFVVAGVHAMAGRYGMAVEQVAATNRLVEQRFSGRLTAGVTTGIIRASALYFTAYMTGSAACLPELLALHDQAVATGDQALRQCAVQTAAGCLSMGCRSDWADAMRGLEDAQMAAAEVGRNTAMVEEAHYFQAGAAVALGAWGDAERHFRRFDHWQASGRLLDPYRWHNFMWSFAMARRDFAEAAGHLERTIAMGDSLGDHGHTAWCREALRSCEEQQARASRRKAGSGPRSGFPSQK